MDLSRPGLLGDTNHIPWRIFILRSWRGRATSPGRRNLRLRPLLLLRGPRSIHCTHMCTWSYEQGDISTLVSHLLSHQILMGPSPPGHMRPLMSGRAQVWCELCHTSVIVPMSETRELAGRVSGRADQAGQAVRLQSPPRHLLTVSTQVTPSRRLVSQIVRNSPYFKSKSRSKLSFATGSATEHEVIFNTVY